MAWSQKERNPFHPDSEAFPQLTRPHVARIAAPMLLLRSSFCIEVGTVTCEALAWQLDPDNIGTCWAEPELRCQLSQVFRACSLATIFGCAVRPMLGIAAPKPPAPETFSCEQWAQLIETSGGAWIGILEPYLAFGAFWIGNPAIVLGWFAFKLATKWEAGKTSFRCLLLLARSLTCSGLLSGAFWDPTCHRGFWWARSRTY